MIFFTSNQTAKLMPWLSLTFSYLQEEQRKVRSKHGIRLKQTSRSKDINCYSLASNQEKTWKIVQGFYGICTLQSGNDSDTKRWCFSLRDTNVRSFQSKTYNSSRFLNLLIKIHKWNTNRISTVKLTWKTLCVLVRCMCKAPLCEKTLPQPSCGQMIRSFRHFCNSSAVGHTTSAAICSVWNTHQAVPECRLGDGVLLALNSYNFLATTRDPATITI